VLARQSDYKEPPLPIEKVLSTRLCRAIISESSNLNNSSQRPLHTPPKRVFPTAQTRTKGKLRV
jgi:hypothetical protein